MASRKQLMAIAGLSTFIHVCMTLFTIISLVQLVVLSSFVDHAEDEGYVKGIVVTILVITLLLEITVVLVSVYLIQGIKKERHQFVAPWIYATGIYTILSVIGLIRGTYSMDATFIIRVIILILHAAMWYPVFRYWRDLRTRPNTNVRENSLLSVGFTTQTPCTVYNAGPENWQQGQTGANYYPPPGYIPQMQTEHIKSTINPQLASVSYPKQMTSLEGAANQPSNDKEIEQAKSNSEYKE